MIDNYNKLRNTMFMFLLITIILFTTAMYFPFTVLSFERYDKIKMTEYIILSSEMAKIENYLKLAYTLNTDEQYSEFLKQSQEIMDKSLYETQIVSGYAYNKNRGIMTIRTITKGFTRVTENTHKFYFRFELISENNISRLVDCFVLTDGKLILTLRGY